MLWRQYSLRAITRLDSPPSIARLTRWLTESSCDRIIHAPAPRERKHGADEMCEADIRAPHPPRSRLLPARGLVWRDPRADIRGSCSGPGGDRPPLLFPPDRRDPAGRRVCAAPSLREESPHLPQANGRSRSVLEDAGYA